MLHDTISTPIVEYHPGDRVPEGLLAENGEEQFFQNLDIPDSIFELMQGKTFKADCTTRRDDLRYLLCLHRHKLPEFAGNYGYAEGAWGKVCHLPGYP